MTDYSIGYITNSSKDENVKIAKVLLKEKLIACANIIPGIESIFEWEGKINYENESLMMIKCPSDNIATIKQVVKANHKYDVPEIIFTTINDGNEVYLDWIKKSTIIK